MNTTSIMPTFSICGTNGQNTVRITSALNLSEHVSMLESRWTLCGFGRVWDRFRGCVVGSPTFQGHGSTRGVMTRLRSTEPKLDTRAVSSAARYQRRHPPAAGAGVLQTRPARLSRSPPSRLHSAAAGAALSRPAAAELFANRVRPPQPPTHSAAVHRSDELTDVSTLGN